MIGLFFGLLLVYAFGVLIVAGWALLMWIDYKSTVRNHPTIAYLYARQPAQARALFINAHKWPLLLVATVQTASAELIRGDSGGPTAR